MFEKWISASFSEMGMVLLCSAVTYAAILLYTRMVGLRSFSKISASDFAMTVAVGSLFGSTISTPTPTLIMGLTALGAVFAGQWLMAVLRERLSWFNFLVDNQPLLLMAGNQILDDNLARAQVTRSDIYAKLRASNTLNRDQVLAVVFETTGDISVLHADDPDVQLSREIFDGVVGAEKLFAKVD